MQFHGGESGAVTKPSYLIMVVIRISRIGGGLHSLNRMAFCEYLVAKEITRWMTLHSTSQKGGCHGFANPIMFNGLQKNYYYYEQSDDSVENN